MIRQLLLRALLWLVFFAVTLHMVRGKTASADSEVQSQSGPNASDSAEETFLVRAWAFDGVTVFDEEELQALLANYSGIKISFAQIKNVVSKIEQYYEKNGYLAQAIVPPQDISSGLVQIEVVEAYIGEINIEEGSSSLVRDGIILSMVGASLKEGELYDADSLNRGLLLADDLSGVSLTGFLEQGSEPGLVDLNLKTLKEGRATAELSIDNANARALGSERIIFSGRLVSPLKMAEVFSFKSLLSEGSFYRGLSASVPLGATGFKLKVFVSNLSYDVVADEFKALNISGEVEEEGLELTYPLYRTSKANLYWSAKIDNRAYSTHVSGTSVKDSLIESKRTELSANLFDEILGGGANAGNLSFSRGDLGGFGVLPSMVGEYSIYNYSLSRQQAITDKLSLFASMRGQFTDGLSSGSGQEDYLDSAENFSLGGLYGVRAYPSGEATGAQGRLISMEFRYLLSQSLVLRPHYDWGKVEKRNISSGGPGEYEISGTGLGLSWTAPWSLNVQATLARRIGSNPNPQLSGSDQDGSFKENRLWLAVSRSF